MPGGLGPRLMERLRERIRRETTQGVQGGGGGGWLDRFRSWMNEWWGGQEEPEGRKLRYESLSIPEYRERFRRAGRYRVLVLLRYNAAWRHVEPYSFRKIERGDRALFFGFCRIHEQIHSFRLDRVQGAAVTDEPFAPRWPVELA